MQSLSADEYLKQYGKVLDLIKRKQAEAEAIIEALELVGINYERDKVQTSLSDRMANVFAKADLMYKAIEKDIERLLDIHKEICEVIEKVSDNRLRRVLTLRYINLMSWEDVADTMYLSRSRIHYLKREALQEVEKILKNT